MLKVTKKKLKKEDEKEFFDTVDKERSSAPNEELMVQVAEFFCTGLIKKGHGG